MEEWKNGRGRNRGMDEWMNGNVRMEEWKCKNGGVEEWKRRNGGMKSYTHTHRVVLPVARGLPQFTVEQVR